MKRFLILCLLVGFQPISFAQNSPKVTGKINQQIKGPEIDPKILAQVKYTPTSDFVTELNCNNSVVLNGCNYITNNNFTPTAAYNPSLQNHLFNPFEESPFNLVPNWVASSGTPQITDGIWDFANGVWIIPPSVPPAPATGYAYGVTFPGQFSSNEEGVAQRIPPLTIGKTYLLSFFDKLQTWGLSNLSLESYNIVLMHCDEANSIFTYPNATPVSIPTNSQTVVCHNNVTTSWQRFITTFVANDDYNAIIFYPRNNYTATATGIGVSLAFPELIDISNFSAGPNPVPTPPNCMVNLGSPNCGVANAVFTWYRPDGQVHTTTTQANQQIQVDASNPLYVGTWTLTMTVPNALTPNGTCSQTPTISSTVTVPFCGSVWPKVYYTSYPQLTGDKNGNVFANLHSYGMDFTQNVNHIGDLPPIPHNGLYTFQYNTSGITNWTKFDLMPLYVLNSGDIQMGRYGTNGIPIPISYCNGITGLPTLPPMLVPANEIIMAETSNGGFITKNSNTIFYHMASGATASVNVSVDFLRYKFNPVTNRLFVNDIYNSFKVYDLSNNNFNLISSSPVYTNLWVVQISNQDKVYVYGTNAIQEYNYLTNTFSNINIPGFPDSNLLFPTYSNNSYTEDRCLVLDQLLNKIYAIDFVNNTCKKIDALLTALHVESFTYLFDGNFVHISSCVNSPSYIGTQLIPVLPLSANNQTGFIAKLNVQTDFSFRQSELKTEEIRSPSANTFEVSISPNPTTDVVSLKITAGSKSNSSSYSLIITNHTGTVVLQKSKYSSNLPLSVVNLPKGIYYIEVTNSEGEKVTKPFIKF